MAFWRLYYHVVWATKERQPLITAEIESELYGYMIGKADALECVTHAIGGIDDHVHIVASIPPKLAVAEFVQKIKGSSAFHIIWMKTTAQRRGIMVKPSRESRRLNQIQNSFLSPL